MRNTMDLIEVTHDLIRKREAEHLFRELSNLYDTWKEMPDSEFGLHSEAKQSRLLGMEWALNLLDERIGFLRDKWEQ